MILSFIVQNLIYFKTRKKRVFPGFFSQLPETRVFKFCPEWETLPCVSSLLYTRVFYSIFTFLSEPRNNR